MPQCRISSCLKKTSASRLVRYVTLEGATNLADQQTATGTRLGGAFAPSLMLSLITRRT